MVTALDTFYYDISSVRSIVALNLPSYGSGRNPWGNLKQEYLEKVWAYSHDKPCFVVSMMDTFTHYLLVIVIIFIVM